MPKLLPTYKDFDLDSLRPFSEIRLVALDLDGTLLESNESELPTKVLDLANKLKYTRHIQVRVTIATGRTLIGAHPLLYGLPIYKDTPIILYNGSLILTNKYQILNLKTIPNRSLQQIIKLSSRFNVKVIAYVYYWYGADGPKECALGWSSLDRPKIEHNKMPVEWLDWHKVESTITPSAIVIHTSGKAEANSIISSELRKINDISHTHGGTYIEVKPKNSNKGIALEYAAKVLNLTKNQVLAIGDNDNDAEMLSWAGIGVAVNSASDLAESSCDYRANRGVIEGAIEVLDLVHKARRLLGQ